MISSNRRFSPSPAAWLLALLVASFILYLLLDRPLGLWGEKGALEEPYICSETFHLAADEPFEQEIAPGEIHCYHLRVEENHLLHLVVDQHGIDVIATLFDPRGRLLVRMDRPTGDSGPEPLLALAETAGIYALKVEAPAGDRRSGLYMARVEELRPAKEIDRQRVNAARIFSEGEELRRRGKAGEAVERFQEALSLWQELNDPAWQAESLERLGRLYAGLGEWVKAAMFHERAAVFYHDEDDKLFEARALHFQGLALFYMGRTEDAIDHYQEALCLRQQTGNRLGEVITTQALAQAYHVLDEVQRALDCHERALFLLDQEEDDQWLRALSVHDLGVLYLALGEMDQARDYLEDARHAWKELNDRRRQAASLSQLGRLYAQLGDLETALSHHRHALTLRRETGDQRGVASSLSKLGLVYQWRGELAQAHNHYQQALAILRHLGRPWSEAVALRNLASLNEELDQPEKAADLYRQSLIRFRQVGDLTGWAESLVGIARSERMRGKLKAALDASQDALEIFESVRPRPMGQELRTSFFVTVQRHFEFHIDLLMEFHRQVPNVGYDAAALTAAEQARARSLLDLLREAEAEIHAGADPALLVRESDLRKRLNNLERRRLELLDDPAHGIQQLAKVEKELRRVLRQLDKIRGEIRVQSPRYAALSQPQPSNLSEIQSLLQDDQTLLLEYKLGEERSFLWAVTPTSLTSYELPRREEIENVAREAYELLIRSHRREAKAATNIALRELTEQVLRPVAHQLPGKRLVVVSDGALQFIPFAALPDPCARDRDSSTPPLIVEHEITYLPSASALAMLREKSSARAGPTGSIAMIADPVFQASDERIPASAIEESGESFSVVSSVNESDAVASLARSAGGVAPSHFERLPFSRQEANTILSMVSRDRSFLALGFAANKETVTQGLLAGYRVVHFATHGILNTEHPELSGIALSFVDEQGRPREGFLREHEIYNLELACDLVVLSACETALGKKIKGEGLTGLTRAFMCAGAARVMVSLWKVSDRGTAEFMEHFYRGLFQQGLRPAAALRAAQISTWRQGERTAPYFWAGFVIQGEWN